MEPVLAFTILKMFLRKSDGGGTLTVQFLREQNTKNVEELISTTRYPLDNMNGNSPLGIEKEISHSLSTETSVTRTAQVAAKLSAEVLEVLRAEISDQLTQQTGHRIGETLVRKEKITMVAQPKTRVTYVVQWFQSVRVGECVFSVGSDTTIVPYRTTYNLHSEVSAE